MAHWLARHWPQHLHLDWPEIDDPDKIVEILPLLVPFNETHQFDDFDFTAKEWIERLKGADGTDAAFIIRRNKSIYSNSFEREQLHDRLDLAFRLEPGSDTPSSTHAKYSSVKIKYQTQHYNANHHSYENLLHRNHTRYDIYRHGKVPS